MQSRDNLHDKPQARTSERAAAAAGSNVVSLAAARLRREHRRQRHTREEPVFEGIDLFGLDFERLDPAARRLYWFNVTNYARHLYATACDAAITEGRDTYAEVSVDHLRKAEQRRLGALRRKQGEFGVVFILEALQILGAAACGALATAPALVADKGPLPLIVALTATAAVFLAREHFASRAST